MTSKDEVTGKKHAVILSGGGANGAYEVGVMKALFGGYVKLAEDPTEGPTKIDPRIFTGTSVGSYSAAFMVSRPGQSEDAVTHDCVLSGCIFPTINDLCEATDRSHERRKYHKWQGTPSTSPVVAPAEKF